MLRLPLTIDSQPRTNNGQPAHSTTGVASTNWIHGGLRAPGFELRRGRDHRQGQDRNRQGSATQNRRVMSTSSGLASSAPVIVRGSSAIPQIGQLRVDRGRFPDASGRCIRSVPRGESTQAPSHIWGMPPARRASPPDASGR